MKELKGKYNSAKVFTDFVEEEALNQIQTLLDQKFVEGEKIRVMPDVHAGKGCTIGYTQTLNSKKVCPSLVGVDIGCGVLLVNLGKIDVDFNKLDKVIRQNVPCGMEVNDHKTNQTDLTQLYCYKSLKNLSHLEGSVGSLGSGNHYIELDKDEEGNVYLNVHSGSRNLGCQVAKFYQDMANDNINNHKKEFEEEKEALIQRLKEGGLSHMIADELKKLTSEYGSKAQRVPYDLAWLEGEDFDNYIHDMKICQEFARENREAIANTIIKKYGIKHSNRFETIETIHNYIDMSDPDNLVLRKGSVCADDGKKLIIPISMKDGALICEGLDNEDYNSSAPHGAGRLMSRAKARETIKMEDFKESMKGIYTTCIGVDTIDESCFAYKTLDMILPNIKDTVNVIKRIYPVYNFKAGE